MDDASSEQMAVPLDLLREITDDFSEERKLGCGSHGKVYLGVHRDGRKIAVKMINDMPGVDDKQFQNEFKNLTRLRHRNIVRLVGYCHDIQEVPVKHEGKWVLAEKTQRALCLEYMSNGSLEKFLSDECDKYDWHIGYGIIKGICQGLKYLHKELKPPIYHLDLKPANILLDENMIPRIADFGISRLFGDEQTRATRSYLGTIGYLPPEYIRNNLISSKFDIFSLGVIIIKIMAGRSGYFNITDMSSQEFTNLVQEKWTNRLHQTSDLTRASSEQVKICIEIGLSCVQEDRHKRPAIQDIVDRLNATETECSLDYTIQRGNIYSPNHQQATLSRNDSSSSYNVVKKVSVNRKFGRRKKNPGSLTPVYFNNGHPVREVSLNNAAGPSIQARTAWQYTTDMTAEHEHGERHPYLQQNGFSRANVFSNNGAGLSKKETPPFSQYPHECNLHQGLCQHDPSMPHYGTPYNLTQANVLNAEGSCSAQRTVLSHNFPPVPADEMITGASLTDDTVWAVPISLGRQCAGPRRGEAGHCLSLSATTHTQIGTDGVGQGSSSLFLKDGRSSSHSIRRPRDRPRIEESHVADQAFIGDSIAILPTYSITWL